MAYADLTDVLALGGALLEGVDQGSTPSTADIDRFLENATRDVDAVVVAAGFAAPVEDPAALGALRNVVAKAALVSALDARYQTTFQNTGEEPLPLRREARDDVRAEMRELRNGTHPAITALRRGGPGQGSAGAGGFWVDEPGYLPPALVDPAFNRNLQPETYKGMPL